MPRIAFVHVVAASVLVGFLVVATGDFAAAQLFRRKEVCTEQQDPVCARTRRKVLATYPNECYANRDRAIVVSKGSCPNVGCPMLWAPVCGRKGGKNESFANSCLAEKGGAVVIAAGSCPGACTPIRQPVCAVDDTGKRSTFRSACEAVLAGARMLHPRDCLGDRACTPGGRGVCAIDPQTNKPTQYATVCDAERANAMIVREGPCRQAR
jgi:hypothetical protein